uniref:Uncharacterized protein n=1 Tax=Anguilla anguilla TaxID=7936 RepID=A0A0E9WBV8_ANGAN
MQLIVRMQNGHCSVLISFHYCKQCGLSFLIYWVCFNFLYLIFRQ